MNQAKQQNTETIQTEISRVARQLWREAGQPAGRYIEYLAKVERTLLASGDTKAIESMTGKTAEAACSHKLDSVAALHPAH